MEKTQCLGLAARKRCLQCECRVAKRRNEDRGMLTDAELHAAYAYDFPNRHIDGLRAVARRVAAYIIAQLPGGTHCDPQEVADRIRADYGIEP